MVGQFFSIQRTSTDFLLADPLHENYNPLKSTNLLRTIDTVSIHFGASLLKKRLVLLQHLLLTTFCLLAGLRAFAC